MAAPFGNRDDRLAAIIAATLKSQGYKLDKPKKNSWLTRREAEKLHRERFLLQIKNTLTEG